MFNEFVKIKQNYVKLKYNKNSLQLTSQLSFRLKYKLLDKTTKG